MRTINRILITTLTSLLTTTTANLRNPTSSQPPPQHPDLIQSLPGYNGPSPLPQDWYSGYLTYTLGSRVINTHYLYIESESLDNDSPDTPLIFWSNGGPGASSLFGVFTELGPLLLSDLSLQTTEYNETGIPTLIPNPHSWTRLGSLLLFDAPAPVGYSYCDDNLAGDGYSCGGWDDTLAAENNYAALLAFYDKFPHLKARRLYLTGESYAGVYIPSFARAILEGGDDEIHLVGFAVGDACVGTESVCGNDGDNREKILRVKFLAGHGQIPWETYEDVFSACDNVNDNTDCWAALQKVNDQVGDYFEYSLYDDCTYRRGLDLLTGTGTLKNYAAPCGGGEVLNQYLSLPSVKKALNIPPKVTFFISDNEVGFNYTPSEPDLRPFYIDLAKGQKYGSAVRTLVYNGDADPAITSFAAREWTSNLGLDEVQPWRPWTVDGCRRMGGYVTRYEGDFDFLTIRGAGHMVPSDKPDVALAFVAAWIGGSDYPHLNKDCEQPEMDVAVD